MHEKFKLLIFEYEIICIAVTGIAVMWWKPLLEIYLPTEIILILDQKHLNIPKEKMAMTRFAVYPYIYTHKREAFVTWPMI